MENANANLRHDWHQTKQKLIAGSIPAFEAFFAVHPLPSIRAIGYTWEWGQPQAAFYCVGNTQAGLERALSEVNRYRPEPLSAEAGLEEVRWDAGYFPFPGGLTGPNDELGAEWEAEAAVLHAITETMTVADTNDEAAFNTAYAEYSRNYNAFLASLVTTCCEALVEIAVAGHLGDYARIDFWVGSTDENGDVVRKRDSRIREMIAGREKRSS